MEREEQLAWESRAGKPAAAAAFVSAFAGAVAIVVGAAASANPRDDTVDSLFLVHRHVGALEGGSALQALSLALLAPVLVFLYRAARYRRPEVPRAAFWLAVLTPPATAVITVVSAVQRANAADTVVRKLGSGPLPPKAANKLADHELTHQLGGVGLGYVGIVLLLLMAFAIGLNAIHARRAGLLSQFMGILGVITGVLLVINILGPPIVQFFWTVALGLLFIDRWPGGNRGPAWESGEAIPWPTAAETRAAQLGEDGGGARPQRPPRAQPSWLERLSGGGATAAAGNGDEPIDVDETPEPARAASPHPRSKKRKKKKRR
jgi:hypothetical protein